MLVADYDILGEFLAGKTQYGRFSVYGDSPQRFDFILGAMQFTGLADGERDKVSIYNATFDLTGGYYDNTGGVGQENELVIIDRSS